MKVDNSIFSETRPAHDCNPGSVGVCGIICLRLEAVHTALIGAIMHAIVVLLEEGGERDVSSLGGG